MNIVFSFHFVLPVLCSMFEKMAQFLGNYRILHVDWCFFSMDLLKAQSLSIL